MSEEVPGMEPHTRAGVLVLMVLFLALIWRIVSELCPNIYP